MLKVYCKSGRQGETEGDKAAGYESNGHCSDTSSNASRRSSPWEIQAVRKVIMIDRGGGVSKGNKKTEESVEKGVRLFFVGPDVARYDPDAGSQKAPGIGGIRNYSRRGDTSADIKVALESRTTRKGAEMTPGGSATTPKEGFFVVGSDVARDDT